MPQHPSLSGQLSAWAMNLRFAAAPDEVKQALRNCLLYT
jgi:hypothetical protein